MMTWWWSKSISALEQWHEYLVWQIRELNRTGSGRDLKSPDLLVALCAQPFSMRFTKRTCTLASSSFDKFYKISYLTCRNPTFLAEDHQNNGCNRRDAVWARRRWKDALQHSLSSSQETEDTEEREGKSFNSQSQRLLSPQTNNRAREGEWNGFGCRARAQLAHRACQGAKIQMTARWKATRRTRLKLL